MFLPAGAPAAAAGAAAPPAAGAAADAEPTLVIKSFTLIPVRAFANRAARQNCSWTHTEITPPDRQVC